MGCTVVLDVRFGSNMLRSYEIMDSSSRVTIVSGEKKKLKRKEEREGVCMCVRGRQDIQAYR